MKKEVEPVHRLHTDGAADDPADFTDDMRFGRKWGQAKREAAHEYDFPIVVKFHAGLMFVGQADAPELFRRLLRVFTEKTAEVGIIFKIKLIGNFSYAPLRID